ncbi:hypothetical protein P7H19_21590 [Paenibacillus larvae]|nr:hypothetical protein [Paenibacillus larvae]MDT2238347.1 hypothetical protein [Paenibacillus larvae]
MDDLARIGTDIAPIDKGTLRRTVDTKVKASKDSAVVGEGIVLGGGNLEAWPV